MAVLAILLFPALGLAVMALWNAVIPAVFGLPSIGFWQALGLLVLSRILFGGFGRWHPGRAGIRERWRGLSPEEKEEFGRRRHHSMSCGHPWREETNRREGRNGPDSGN
jgi:hypothetical protein